MILPRLGGARGPAPRGTHKVNNKHNTNNKPILQTNHIIIMIIMIIIIIIHSTTIEYYRVAFV